MSAKGQRATASRRGTAVLAALLLLAGQLSSLAHLIVVRHVTCAAHGELVDAPSRLQERNEPASGSRISESSDPIDGAHGHDHCVFAAVRRQAAARSITPVAQPVPVAALVRIRDAAAQLVPSPVMLLRLAPKTSPPV